MVVLTMVAVGVWASLPQGVCVCCMIPIVDCCPQKAAVGAAHGGGCCGVESEAVAKGCCAMRGGNGAHGVSDAALKRCDCPKTPVNLILATANSAPQREVQAPVAVLPQAHDAAFAMDAFASAPDPYTPPGRAAPAPVVLRI